MLLWWPGSGSTFDPAWHGDGEEPGEYTHYIIYWRTAGRVIYNELETTKIFSGHFYTWPGILSEYRVLNTECTSRTNSALVLGRGLQSQVCFPVRTGFRRYFLWSLRAIMLNYAEFFFFFKNCDVCRVFFCAFCAENYLNWWNYNCKELLFTVFRSDC